MKAKHLNILAMSDLHGFLMPIEEMIEWLDKRPVDVVCITGDIVPLDYQRDTIESLAWLCKKFLPWAESLPCDKVIFCWGNHDFIGETLRIDKHGNHRKANRVMKKLLASPKVRLVEDSEFMYEGYKFYGTSWCRDLKNWAFYKPADELLKAFQKIPGDTDVLLTHCPPQIMFYGIVHQPGFNCMNDYGSPELAEVVRSRKPKLHLFGHVHTGDHTPNTIDGTTFCNVSLLDENYKLAYEPLYYSI